MYYLHSSLKKLCNKTTQELFFQLPYNRLE